jgi:hypothetical protein
MAQALAAEEEAKKAPRVGRDPRKLLEAAKAEEQRIIRMIRRGTYDEDKGHAEVVNLREKIRTLEANIRALGRVLEVPALSRVEAICKAIADGPEPEGYDRRHVLEGLIDFVVTMTGHELTITGKVPMDLEEGSAAGPEEGEKNRRNRLAGAVNSFNFIPFILKAKLAA